MTLTNPILGRFIRFGIVGTSGFIIDFSITAILYEFLALSIIVATGVGFCFGATSNYFLNRIWTWRSTNPNIRGEYFKFLGVSLIGLGIHYLILLLCMSLPFLAFSLLGFQINNDWTSKLVATGTVLVWNFFANNHYTFSQQGLKQ